MSHAIRLRRALSLSTAILSPTRRTTVSVALTAVATTLNQTSAAVNSAVRHFHSTQQLSFNNADMINADTVLFEGCDYNHFLIVMNFGRDPDQRPTPDQMIETYVQTCAKVLGNVEEAKRKIYACSTTSYTGFQVEVDEETSKKFEGLAGVMYVLPDSYIDPVNKEYGGDKYNYGEIIPRSPPAHYGRLNRVSTWDDQMSHRSTPITFPREPAPYYEEAPLPRDNVDVTVETAHALLDQFADARRILDDREQLQFFRNMMKNVGPLIDARLNRRPAGPRQTPDDRVQCRVDGDDSPSEGDEE